MRKPTRFAIRLDGDVLPITLPLDRAERVAAHAVGGFGQHDVAEILEDGDPVISYARVDE